MAEASRAVPAAARGPTGAGRAGLGRARLPHQAALALSDEPGEPSEPSEASLHRALAILQDLGATAAGVRCIPVGPRSATRGHPAGLTQREREVLDLVSAAGT